MLRSLARRAFSTSSASLAAVVRRPAPAWKAPAVVNEDFVDLDSATWATGKWRVVFFYPLNFTYVCPTEITAFSDRIAEFKAMDVEVAAVSIDSKFSHLAWIQTPRNKGGLGKMAIPVIADVTKEMSKAFGVLIEGADDGDAGVALRGTFLIDPSGVVRHSSINDLPVGRSVDEVLRLLSAFKYVEKHGEVCPAGWKAGAKSMKADPKGSQEFFKTLA